MIHFGKIALFLWALLLGYVGLLLAQGQGGVAMGALEAGRFSEALMQFTFIIVVLICTVATVGLFVFVGVLRE